jgi:hypothetical protein
LDASTRLKRSDNVTFQNIAGEAILIRLSTGTYFSLNPVGTEFWEMLDGQQTIEQHAATIAAMYSVDALMVVSDLLELAEKMAVDDLVEAM